MLLPAGGCCACSTAPTPPAARAGSHRCCWEPQSQGCASAGPGRRPPLRVGIPCIAAAGAWAGRGTAGSTRATATRSGPRIATGTVPCPRPGPAHSPSLWSRLIPKEILFPAAGDPRWAGALLVMPGIMPTVWRLQTGARAQSTSARPAPHRQGLWGSSGGPTCSQGITHIPAFSSSARHCTAPQPARAAGLFSCLTHAPSSRGQACLGARTAPGELNPLLSLGHVRLAGALHRTEVFSQCCGGEQCLGSPLHSQREHLQTLSYPRLKVPCSCSSSPWHVPHRAGGRQDSLSPSGALPWGCATGQPWPPARPLLCPRPCLLSREQIPSSWAQTYLSAGTELTQQPG